MLLSRKRTLKWARLLLWVVIAILAAPLAGRLSDVVQANGGNSIRDAFSKLSRIDAAGLAEMSP